MGRVGTTTEPIRTNDRRWPTLHQADGAAALRCRQPARRRFLASGFRQRAPEAPAAAVAIADHLVIMGKRCAGGRRARAGTWPPRELEHIICHDAGSSRRRPGVSIPWSSQREPSAQLCHQPHGGAAQDLRRARRARDRARARPGRDPQRSSGRGDQRRHAAGPHPRAGRGRGRAHHLDQRAAALQRLERGAGARGGPARRLCARLRRAGAGALPGQRRRLSPLGQGTAERSAPRAACAGADPRRSRNRGPGRAARLRDQLAALQGGCNRSDRGDRARRALPHRPRHVPPLPLGRAAPLPGMDRARAHLGRRRPRSAARPDARRAPGAGRTRTTGAAHCSRSWR